MCKKCKNCDCVYLFVYGTLKKGGALNGGINDRIKQEFGYVPGELIHPSKMYDLGWYPCIVLDNDVQLPKITGEIVKLSASNLDYLDMVEGSDYTRNLLSVQDKHGKVYECYVYVFNGSLAWYPNARHIKEGTWEIKDTEMS